MPVALRLKAAFWASACRRGRCCASCYCLWLLWRDCCPEADRNTIWITRFDMATSTADLCDKYADSVQIADSIFTDFGGALDFFGPISTIKCFEDNSQVRKALETPGQGRVLVIDGGASDRCALVGDRMAHLAIDNDWAGLIIYGCVRDAAELADMPIAIKAL